jgi:virulence factor Mce-like protein
MRRRRGPALSASPVLVGAVTLLIVIVAVFITYNANQGLPFVPTYDLKAQLLNGYKLVEGNDVRAGGFRVGVIDSITSDRVEVDGKERSIAVIGIKLDKDIEPLPVDSALSVRSRSALGLKYLELRPGSSKQSFEPGATVPLRNSIGETEDLEDVLASFPPDVREAARSATTGFADALTGRGPAINTVIAELRPFLTRLTPVMENLSAPSTELVRLFPALERAVGETAPVAEVQARWIADMATTFGALSSDPEALRETISESPVTLEAATRSFRVQTPFLARFADLSRRLVPAAEELRVSLPAINDALAAGVPAFEETPALASDLEGLFRALEDLGDNPNSLLALQDLRRAVQIARPAVEYVAPYQTVCNFLIYFFNPLSTHLSEAVAGGTAERIYAKLLSGTQPNNLGTTESTRPVDVPANRDPQALPAMQALHAQGVGPAVDGAGRADCQNGQKGYLNRLVTDGRWPPSNAGPNFEGGGSHVVVDPNSPGLAGGTFKSRELGINSVDDVP